MPKRAYIVTPSPRRVRSRTSMARRSRAATTIARAWRARRPRASRVRRTRMIGSSIWRGNCKQTITAEVAATTRTDNTLWNQEITDCPQGSEMNQRERGIINCRGFKIDYFFQNVLANSAVFCNFAVLAPKSLSSDSNAVEAGQFFRAAGQNRAQSFNTVGVQPFARHILNINPDEYIILWHKRWILGPAAQANGEQAGMRPSFNWLHKYIKLNRAVTYQAAESQSATDGKVAVAYWFGQVGGTTDTSVQTAAVQVSDRVVMFFKEPKQ